MWAATTHILATVPNPFYYDFETYERRGSQKSDVANSARLSLAQHWLRDVPSGHTRLESPSLPTPAKCLKCCKIPPNPLSAGVDDVEGLEEQFEMMAAVRGSWEAFAKNPSPSATPAPCNLLWPFLLTLPTYPQNAAWLSLALRCLGCVSPMTIAGSITSALRKTSPVSYCVSPSAPATVTLVLL